MSAVGSMCAAAHEAGNENDFAAGTGLINAASAFLVSSQVAWAVGTKSACIVCGSIHDLVSVSKYVIPASERCHTWLGNWTHLLVLFLSLFNDSSDVDLDILHILNRKAAFLGCHRNLSLLFL